MPIYPAPAEANASIKNEKVVGKPRVIAARMWAINVGQGEDGNGYFRVLVFDGRMNPIACQDESGCLSRSLMFLPLALAPSGLYLLIYLYLL